MPTEYGITLRQNYEDIANAIRQRGGFTDTYMPSEMAPAILAIPYNDWLIVYTDSYGLPYSENNATSYFTLQDGAEINAIMILYDAYDYTGQAATQVVSYFTLQDDAEIDALTVFCEAYDYTDQIQIDAVFTSVCDCSDIDAFAFISDIYDDTSIAGEQHAVTLYNNFDNVTYMSYAYETDEIVE